MHKGECTILCSPPDLYGTSDGWGAQSGAVRRGVHIPKKKCHPYGWHLRLSKNDKTQSCNRAAGIEWKGQKAPFAFNQAVFWTWKVQKTGQAAGRKDFFDTLTAPGECSPGAVFSISGKKFRKFRFWVYISEGLFLKFRFQMEQKDEKTQCADCKMERKKRKLWCKRDN